MKVCSRSQTWYDLKLLKPKKKPFLWTACDYNYQKYSLHNEAEYLSHDKPGQYLQNCLSGGETETDHALSSTSSLSQRVYRQPVIQ